jgi:uncharacterized protein (TIGR03067 family)
MTFVRISLLGVMFFFCAAARPGIPPVVENDPKVDDPKKARESDKVRLQGSWITISGETGGKKISKELTKEQIYEFRGSDLLIHNKGILLVSIKFALDESKKPKEMDILLDLERNPAIYRLEGDSLTICMDKPGGVRPKAFETKADNSNKLFVFKRHKQKK